MLKKTNPPSEVNFHLCMEQKKRSMKQHYQILIVGGGNAGISLAAQLSRKDKRLDIGIMDPADKHYYQPAWTLVGGGDFDVRDTVRSEAEVMPRQAKWIKEAAVKLEPDQNAVISSAGVRYTYDYLVVCPGIQLDWHKIKGIEGHLGKNGITSNYTFEAAPVLALGVLEASPIE